jgi:hypothetical protein
MTLDARLTAATGAVALALFASYSRADQPGAPAQLSDQVAIYEAFIDSWERERATPINLSAEASAVTPRDLKEFAGCSGDASNWVDRGTKTNLREVLAGLPSVRLVDPNHWKLEDPGDLISQGQPIDAAVESGFSHGLMTVSAVSFDSTRQTAALVYSFVCGGLCGSGGVALFERKGRTWIRSNKQCVLWVSATGRPDNAFKLTPPQGVA